MNYFSNLSKNWLEISAINKKSWNWKNDYKTDLITVLFSYEVKNEQKIVL